MASSFRSKKPHLSMTENRSVRLDGVYTAYEGASVPTLRNISLEVGGGEYVLIGGPNGAGKTTLLESIMGMLKITHGDAMVCGLDARKDGLRVRRKVGYVIQNFSFDPLTPYTAEQVVMMGRYGIMGCLKRPCEADFRAADEAMHLLGIEDLAAKPIGILSGGQQQKVLIAQNLAKEPGVLLLDEPFSNLDIAAREFITVILEKIAGKGIPIMMVSHAFDDLPDRDIRVLVMNDGTITYDAVSHPGDVEARVKAASGVV
jgi:zinc/manganese transport system ATP-binding protein